MQRSLCAIGCCLAGLLGAGFSAPQRATSRGDADSKPPAELWLSPFGVLDSGPIHLEGGQDCNTPVGIPSLPIWLTGSTANHINSVEIACPRQGAASPDATYLYLPPRDMTVNISLCNPGTNFDTRLDVFAGDCTPEGLLACNDEACPGHTSQILNLPLSAGTAYFIVVDGYAGALGNYEMTITESPPTDPPACPPSSPFGQLPTGIGTAAVSDVHAGSIRYEKFDVTGSFAAVRFWGLALSFNGSWLPCAADPKQFTIKFYPDAGNRPGSPTCTQVLNLSPSNAWLLYDVYPLYEYEATFATPCNLPNGGWISIQGGGTPDECWFMWMSSPSGDGFSWVDSGLGLTRVSYDLSLCVSDAAIPTGACCVPDGTCQVLSQAACQGLGGSYQGDATLCDPNPCGGTPTGPCCVSDHTCIVLTQADCGRLLRGDANCDGHVDFGDINAFVAVLVGGTACLSANCDVNGDGTIDFGDINPFVDVLVNGNPPSGTWLGAGHSCTECP